MVKDPEALEEFEESYQIYSQNLEYNKALKIYSEMWQYARTLCKIDPLDGIETDIRIAAILNKLCLKK